MGESYDLTSGGHHMGTVESLRGDPGHDAECPEWRVNLTTPTGRVVELYAYRFGAVEELAAMLGATVASG